MEVLNQFDKFVSLNSPLDFKESKKIVVEFGCALSGILHVGNLISSYNDETHSDKISFNSSTEERDEVPELAIKLEKISLESEETVCTNSVSLSTPLKLVSAMKGGRGAPPKKLTVSWAPDVYDPPSTLISHTVNSYKQHRLRSNKKSSKHKQKGKSSRGSSSEKKHEKKQYRKYAESFELRSRSSHIASESLFFGDLNNSQSVDSNCGSSFLKEELCGKVHLSIAEAT